MLAQLHLWAENNLFEEFYLSFNCFKGNATFLQKKLSIIPQEYVDITHWYMEYNQNTVQ